MISYESEFCLGEEWGWKDVVLPLIEWLLDCSRKGLNNVFDLVKFLAWLDMNEVIVTRSAFEIVMIDLLRDLFGIYFYLNMIFHLECIKM
jgi:hypothetical protein